MLGEGHMTLWLPDNIPIAAQSFTALEAKGTPKKILVQPGLKNYPLARALEPVIWQTVTLLKGSIFPPGCTRLQPVKSISAGYD
jgi:hypothetical protein